MNVTLIGYEEAAGVLNAGESTIRRAVKIGNLTKVEISGLKQHVIEEQVKLFKNESQIRKSLLKGDKLEAWENYNFIAKNYSAYKIGNTKEISIPNNLQKKQVSTENGFLETLSVPLEIVPHLKNKTPKEIRQMALDIARQIQKGGPKEKEKFNQILDNFSLEPKNSLSDIESIRSYVKEYADFEFLTLIKIMINRQDLIEYAEVIDRSLATLEKHSKDLENVNADASQALKNLEDMCQRMMLTIWTLQEKIDADKAMSITV